MQALVRNLDSVPRTMRSPGKEYLSAVGHWGGVGVGVCDWRQTSWGVTLEAGGERRCILAKVMGFRWKEGVEL